MLKKILPLLLLSSCGFLNTPQKGNMLDPETEQIIIKARNYQHQHLDSCLFLAKKAYKQASTSEQMRFKAESAYLIGYVYYEMGLLAPSIAHLHEALLYASDRHDLQQMAQSSALLSLAYQRSDNPRQAYFHAQQARKWFEATQDMTGQAEIYGNIGHLLEKQQTYDSALFYQQKAMRLYQQLQDTAGIATIHDNIGSIYEDLGEYAKAQQYFENAYQLNTAIHNAPHALVNLNNIADTYRKRGELSKALIYAEATLREAEALHLKYQIRGALRDLAKTYHLLGKNELAYQFLEKSYDVTHELFSEQMARDLAKNQSIYELEQKQQQISLLEKEQQLHQLYLWLSAAAVLLVILLGFGVFRNQKLKNTKEKQLLATEAELARADLINTQLNEEKLKAELENQKLQEDKLQYELELKSKSLTNTALHLVQKNEFLDELRASLKKIKKAPAEEMASKIKKLTKAIDRNFSLDEDWQEFESIFQQVHSGFFENLKEKYPDLTSNEVRLCAMIRLNLQSRDIATIMGISQDSLRIARYRLRKRLEIEKGTNLYSFILSIG